MVFAITAVSTKARATLRLHLNRRHEHLTANATMTATVIDAAQPYGSISFVQ